MPTRQKALSQYVFICKLIWEARHMMGRRGSQDAILIVRASSPLALPWKGQLQWIVVICASICAPCLPTHLPCRECDESSVQHLATELESQCRRSEHQNSCTPSSLILTWCSLSLFPSLLSFPTTAAPSRTAALWTLFLACATRLTVLSATWTQKKVASR